MSFENKKIKNNAQKNKVENVKNNKKKQCIENGLTKN